MALKDLMVGSVDPINGIKNTIAFKKAYGGMSQSDIEKLTTYLKLIKASDHKGLMDAIEHLNYTKTLSSIYMTATQYSEILSDADIGGRGNYVWKFKFKHIIDFWNIKNDGMDQCFHECSGTIRLCPKSAHEIKMVLDSEISEFENCCQVKHYLKN